MDTPKRGVSSISIEGDQEAGQQYIPRAKTLLGRLVERARIGNLQTVSDHERLSDFAYVYGLVAMGIQKAVIVIDSPPSKAAETAADRTPPVVPDFYSGATLDGRITDPPAPRPGVLPQPPFLNSWWPTAACADLFRLAQTEQPAARLAVEPYSEFSGVLGPADSYTGPRWSQYMRCKPTMYSGRMRGVVQLLLGFGKQIKDSIYDALPFLGTDRERRAARDHLTPYQTQVRRDGLQIRYDWRWHRTHGIGVGADGVLWLVEIGLARGAIAMPLPLNAFTLKNEFRDKLDQLGDSAGTVALDAFGGWPTGEPFPAGALDAWIRAGRIVRLATVDQLQSFYNLSPFTSAMGWAFNDSGNEARNLGWEIAENGFVQVTHHGFSFTIGSSTAIDPPENAAALRARITQFSEDPNYEAALWKIDRYSPSEVATLLNNHIADDQGLYQALDADDRDPLASASGHLWQASQGYLYKPGKTEQYNLKYPQPELGYLASFNMQPAFGHSRVTPKSDTDVHVFFVGDALHYVRYFNDARTAPAVPVEDDSDGCELVGTFTRTVRSGNTFMVPMVYSSEFDHRRELTPSRSVTVTTGIDYGYCRVTVADSVLFPPAGHLSRTKRFFVKATSDAWSAETQSSVMVVPFDDRCAYYYALQEGSESSSHSVSYGYKTITDPWSCDTWRNFPGFTGTTIANHFVPEDHPDGCGPVTARTVRAPGGVYDGGACSDFADQGSWCHTCDNAESMVYDIPEPPVPAAEASFTVSNRVRTTWLFNANVPAPLQIEQQSVTGDGSFPWFYPSPDAGGLTQYAEVTHNALGDGDGMRYSRAPNEAFLVIGSPLPPNFNRLDATFIGVLP